MEESEWRTGVGGTKGVLLEPGKLRKTEPGTSRVLVYPVCQEGIVKHLQAGRSLSKLVEN